MKVKPHAWAIALLLVVTSTVQTIASAGTFPGGNGRIAFSSAGEIQTILSDGTGRRTLTDTPVGGENQPAWNASGTRLVFTDSGHSFSTMRADGSNRTPLFSHDTFAGNPTWSADGSVVAFDGFIGSMEGNRIFVVPAAGGTATELAGVDAEDPTYSPDGTRIAFENYSSPGIGVMNADGSNVVNITSGAGGNSGDRDPSWSPDGAKIAFSRDFQIWSMNSNGSGATQLTTGLDATHPTWSPDGTKIAFQRDEDIWVMDADGSDAVNITNSPEVEDRHPDWGSTGAPPSGDGAQFTAASFSASETDTAAVITVQRTGDTTGPGMVRFLTNDGTAKASSIRRCLRACQLGPPDYSQASGTLVFAPGQTTTSFRVPITDDGVVEDDETVRLILRRTKGPSSSPLGGQSTATLTIVDNDPNVSFVRPSSMGSEEDGAVVGVLVSTRNATGVTVNYAVTGGTATEGQDYTLGTGILTVRAGKASRIPLSVVDDESKEPNETVRIELSSPVNAELGRITTHTLTIKDDDPNGDVAGDTPATALVVDLVRQPRQVIREVLIPRAGDVADVYRVHLEAGDDVAIDVDPIVAGFFPSLRSSTLTVYGSDGTTQLAVVNDSAEPDGSGTTTNPAHLFHADTEGDYYFSLSPRGNTIGQYRIELHRLALAEGGQDPAALDAAGPMFAWLRGDTLGITGPTGHGFSLQGNWTQTSTKAGRGGTRSSTYTLPAGSEVDLLTAFGELRLENVADIVVTTSPNLWGDTFGVVPAPIPLRMGIPLDALIGDLREEYGLQMSVSALENWTIMMGSDIAAGEGAVPSGIGQVAPGAPYLFFDDEPAIAASFGQVRIEQNALDEKILIILDPTDPFLYIRAEEIRGVKKPTLAFSRRGYIPFHPQLEPTLEDAVGLTRFYSHVFASGEVPPNPALAEYFTINADGSIDLDADDDGTWLAGQGNANQLFMGDLSAIGPVLRDINLGANGRVTFHYNSDQFDFVTPLGRATAVYNGQEEALWFRGRKHPEENPLAGTPFSFLGLTPEDFVEGVIRSNGEFAVTTGTQLNLPGDGLLRFKLDMTNEAITADVIGRVEMKGSVKIDGVEASCVARAGARGLLSFSHSGGNLHMAGSLSADGSVKCKVGGTTVASAKFDVSGRVDDGKIIFRLPLLGEESIRIFS